MTIPFGNLRRRWREDPDYVAQVEALRPEMEIAFALSEARRRAGLSQDELARRMNTSQSVIARWEGGAQEPSFRSIRRFAEAVGARVKVQLVSAEDEASE